MFRRLDHAEEQHHELEWMLLQNYHHAIRTAHVAVLCIGTKDVTAVGATLDAVGSAWINGCLTMPSPSAKPPDAGEKEQYENGYHDVH